MLATTATATDQRANLVYDCGPLGGDCGTERDMAGPTVGYVTYRQRQNGDLQINVAVRSGDPNTTYFVSVYCGPSHDNAIALIDFNDTVSTNASGRGSNTNIVVTAADIAFWCGAGSHTGHIDLDSGSTLAAAPLNFSS